MGKNKFRAIVLVFIVTFVLSANVDAFAANIEATNSSGLEKAILKQLHLTYSDFDIKYWGKIEDIDKTLRNVIHKDPYLMCTITSIEWTTTTEQTGSFNINVKASHIMSADERKEADKKINNILSEIIKPYMTDNEKVKAVHDYIVLNGKYDTNFEYYSDYDLLTEGKSVCNGYAVLTYNMLNKLGIPVKLVFGSSNSQSHVWNMVKLDDYWFHLDTTWDDPVPDKNIASYNYYMLTDEEIMKDHTIDKNQNLPKSTLSYYDYIKGLSVKSHFNYIYEKLLIETGLSIYDDENTANTKGALNNILQQKIKCHPSKISARFSKDITKEDVNDSMSKLFNVKSVSEISYDQILNDKTGKYNILNLYIKYKEVPDRIETDISSKVYNIETKVNYNIYAIYGTKKENITDNVLIYPYDKNFMNISNNTIIFKDSGNQNLTLEYEGKKLDVAVTAINPVGFDYITDEKTKNSVNVKIYDKYIDFNSINQWPFIENGRTLVPLRAVFEVLNCKVNWDASSGSAVVEHGNTKIVIPANSEKAYVNGTSMSLDVPAKLVNNRIMVPLRFISESINKTVIWDNNNSTVLIY